MGGSPPSTAQPTRAGRSAAIDGAEELLASLVALDSTNPSLVPGGAGESAVAGLVAERLQQAGLAVRAWEALPGRESVLGVLKGVGGGRSLLICSHLDVVAANPACFEPAVRDGRMYGRGTCDMKGGLAASILAACELAADPQRLPGDVLIGSVIDEEWLSAGALDLTARLTDRGVRIDGAILPESTGLDLVIEHGGFAWWEIQSTGVEAAGDDPDHGVDAIALLGGVLTGLLELDAELASRPAKPYGRPCIHASTIAGGSQLSAYPGACEVGVERCLVPGETVAQAEAELEQVLARAAARDPRLNVELRRVIGREALSLDRSEAVITDLAAAAERHLGTAPVIRGDMGWMDSGILVEGGIPCVAFGPSGAGEHTADEWVDLESVRTCARVLADAARAFCSVQDHA
jgi:acetylornithine deacetylase